MSTQQAGKDWLGNPKATPKELSRAAATLARSDDIEDLRALLRGLTDAGILGRLDGDEDYVNCVAQQLRIAGVFKHLMRSGSPPAHKVLIALIDADTFRSCDAREELLVKSLAVVKPAPGEAVRYWDAHSQPDSIHLHFVIEALCRNGSEPAIKLLEQKLSDPKQDDSYKLRSMRDPLLLHRNDQLLLEGCHRLLNSGLAPELKVGLVEALVDHLPDEWYPQDHLPMPPARALATPQAKTELEALLKTAQGNLTLTDRLEALVKALLVEIGDNGES